eukprot:763833-Hanusia_phi.AAC.3
MKAAKDEDYAGQFRSESLEGLQRGMEWKDGAAGAISGRCGPEGEGRDEGEGGVEGLTFGQGVATRCCVAPLDVIKIRMQLQASCRSPSHLPHAVLAIDGMAGRWQELGRGGGERGRRGRQAVTCDQGTRTVEGKPRCRISLGGLHGCANATRHNHVMHGAESGGGSTSRLHQDRKGESSSMARNKVCVQLARRLILVDAITRCCAT